MAKIKVDYKFRDGVHCFSSKQMPGLLVMHTDLGRAIADIPRVIEKLTVLNTDREVDAGIASLTFNVLPRC